MRLRPIDALRLIAFGALAAGVSACGGGGSSTPSGNMCYPGVASAIVSPANGSYAPGTGQIVIALQARSDLLGTSWDLILRDNLGSRIETAQLNLIDGSSLPHPFPDTDYFYSTTVSGLPGGRIWNVYLNQYTSTCTSQYLSQFSN